MIELIIVSYLEFFTPKFSPITQTFCFIESKGDIPKIISTNIAKKINPSLEIDEEWVKFIKEKFLVTMPEDFYQFWNFCKKIKPANTLEALREVGLYLIGPFDVLAGKYLFFSIFNIPLDPYFYFYQIFFKFLAFI